MSYVKKLKLLIQIFFLYKFKKSFLYFAKKQRLWGKGKPCLIKLKCFLVVLMTLENGIRFLLTCFEKLFYFGLFWDTLMWASASIPLSDMQISQSSPQIYNIQAALEVGAADMDFCIIHPQAKFFNLPPSVKVFGFLAQI